MSRFSGKCDFCDYLFMGADSEEDAFGKFRGTKLYIMKPSKYCVPVKEVEDFNKNWTPIHYNSLVDLITYYPHIVVFSWCDNQDSEKSIVVLSNESWVDTEEAQYGHWDIHDYYREQLRKEMDRYSVQRF